MNQMTEYDCSMCMNPREFLYHSVDEQTRNLIKRPTPVINAHAN